MSFNIYKEKKKSSSCGSNSSNKTLTTEQRLYKAEAKFREKERLKKKRQEELKKRKRPLRRGTSAAVIPVTKFHRLNGPQKKSSHNSGELIHADDCKNNKKNRFDKAMRG